MRAPAALQQSQMWVVGQLGMEGSGWLRKRPRRVQQQVSFPQSQDFFHFIPINDFVTASSTLTTTSSRAPSSPSPTGPSQTRQPLPSNHIPIPPIVGGVIGGLALLTFLGACFWFIRRRRLSRGGVAPIRNQPVPGRPAELQGMEQVRRFSELDTHREN